MVDDAWGAMYTKQVDIDLSSYGFLTIPKLIGLNFSATNNVSALATMSILSTSLAKVSLIRPTSAYITGTIILTLENQ